MKIALLPNLTREKAQEITIEICHWLKEYGAEFAGCSEDRDKLQSVDNLSFYDFDELIKWCDAVISVGGDGSMLRAAKRIVGYEKPILCINAGRLAFMAGLEANELQLLKKLVDGEYEIDKRMLFDVEHIRDGEVIDKSNCINDVVLARSNRIKINDIDVKCDGRLINTYRSDGIIVATPTGSSAYSLAAGGPVINPSMEAIVVTPISAQSLFARSIVFSSENEIELSMNENSPTKEFILSLDGNDATPFFESDRVIIRKSEHYASFIRIKGEPFFEILNRKLTGPEARS